MRHASLLTVIALLLAACAGAGAGGQPTADPDAPVTDDRSSDPSAGVKGGDADGILTVVVGQATGPGITIDDAVAFTGAGPLLVNGSLFVEGDGRVMLCDAIAESYPPQCGGTRLEVRGLDLSTVPDLEEANGVRWAEQVQVLGNLSFIEG